MRLVDADEIRKKAVPHTRGEHGYNANIRKWAVLVGDIDDAPTIDAAPVDVVAQMLCDAFGDECPCNYNCADEWLSEVCELQDECPNPKDKLGCWKQYIKHFGERKE